MSKCTKVIYGGLLVMAVFMSGNAVAENKSNMLSDKEMQKMMQERNGGKAGGQMSGAGMPMGMQGGRGGMMNMMMGRGGMGRGNMMAKMDLNDKQRKQMRKIKKDLRKKRWNLMGKIMDEKDNLVDLYSASPRDAKAIGKVYGKIFDLKRQIIEASISAGNQRRGVLTKKQQEKLKDMQGMMGGSGGMGMMAGSGGMGMMGGSGGMSMMGGCGGKGMMGM